MIGFGDAARVGPHVVVVRNAVEPAVQRLLAGYGRVVLGGGGFVPDRANHSTVLRGDPLADALLDDATDETARLCGCERLFPLHGEFRLFRGFAVLDDPVHNEDVRLFLLADRADGARVPTIAVEGLDRAVEIGEREFGRPQSGERTGGARALGFRDFAGSGARELDEA